MNISDLIVGDTYNFIGQSERLKYTGKAFHWHQFELASDSSGTWAEVLDSDLHLIEKTKTD